MFRLTISAIAACVTMATAAAATPVQWRKDAGGNGNFYEVVWNHGALSWHQAAHKAHDGTVQGVNGHLATITSKAEQTFLDGLNSDFVRGSKLHKGKYVPAWLGGTDRRHEGSWEWITGEAFDYENFAWHQPNDGGFFWSQDYLLGWDLKGKWNDCSDNCGHKVSKYVVEWEMSEIPVPAALPLTLAGLGALGVVSRRRRRSA